MNHGVGPPSNDVEEDNYAGGWFGESWGAPICEEEEHHRETPTGQLCMDCAMVIVEGDQGLLIPGGKLLDEVIVYTIDPIHIECFRRELRLS